MTTQPENPFINNRFTEDYFSEKYGLSRTHSEVIDAMQHVAPGDALDLGCGSGRNSLYLAARGFNVQAWDHNPMGIDNLNRIAADEQLRHLHATLVDLNSAEFNGSYDFILSTVVLMFLEATTIPRLLDNMQRCTRNGGYNLIVSAMNSSDYPCHVGFPFTFATDELKNYYNGWYLLKYNENVGELHKTDMHGNRIKLRFATLLARKP